MDRTPNSSKSKSIEQEHREVLSAHCHRDRYRFQSADRRETTRNRSRRRPIGGQR